MFNDLIRYQISRPTTGFSKPRRLVPTVRTVLDKFKGDKAIRITDAHGRSSKPMGSAGLKAQLAKQLAGSVLSTVTIESQERTVRIRKIQTRQKVIATTGNQRVDEYFTGLCGKFKGVYSLGAMVCKTVGTTSTPSQHCNWPALAAKIAKQFGFSTVASSAGGNAIDSGHHDPDVMDAIWHWTIANAHALDVENVIHWPKSSPHPLIWNPERGVHEYVVPPGGSDHRDHVHADFRPTRSGTPLC